MNAGLIQYFCDGSRHSAKKSQYGQQKNTLRSARVWQARNLNSQGTSIFYHNHLRFCFTVDERERQAVRHEISELDREIRGVASHRQELQVNVKQLADKFQEIEEERLSLLQKRKNMVQKRNARAKLDSDIGMYF